jgi:hypothetical protein
LNKWWFFTLFQGVQRSIPAASKSAIRRLILRLWRPDFWLSSRREWQAAADLLEKAARQLVVVVRRPQRSRVSAPLSLPSSKYRPDVDGLRAIAVMLVLNYHAFPDAMPGGFIGVDVFFVISGFLITGIITRELELGRFSLIEFYNRRIRRIFPALIVVLSATLALGWFWMLP